MFSIIQKTTLNFSITFILSVANVFDLGMSKKKNNFEKHVKIKALFHNILLHFVNKKKSLQDLIYKI